jgi:anti-sigma-K factor RskA
VSALAVADDLLAAELAFGLLDNEEEEAGRARVAADPRLANRFADWERLAATLLAAGEEPPRPSLWSEIDAHLPGNDNPADAQALAARWRAASVALGVLAAVFGALALRPEAETPATPPSREQPSATPLVAVLRAPGAQGTVAVTFDPGTNRLTLATQALDAHAGSVELWAIAGDAPPRSLGLVPVATPGSRTLHELSRLIAPGVTLAVTLEPRGGSPTGAPSGTPLLTGTVAAATITGA